MDREPGLGPEHDLRLWRLDGERLTQEAARRLPYFCCPVPVPGHDLLAYHNGWDLRFLDSPPSPTPARPPEYTTEQVEGLWASPDLRCCALATLNSIEVDATHPAVTIADRLPAEWVPGDLATLTDTALATLPGSAARPLLDLLQACLEYRFGTDVAIDAATVLPAAADDIALSACGDRRFWNHAGLPAGQGPLPGA